MVRYQSSLVIQLTKIPGARQPWDLYAYPFLKTLQLTVFSGLGQSLPQVVLGRLVAGIGGAGVNSMVSIVIAGEIALSTSTRLVH
jgi:hypothetical protein